MPSGYIYIYIYIVIMLVSSLPFFTCVLMEAEEELAEPLFSPKLG